MSSNFPNSQEENSQSQFIINVNNHDNHMYCNCIYCQLRYFTNIPDEGQSNFEINTIPNSSDIDVNIENENIDLSDIISIIYSYNRQLEYEQQLDEVLERSMDDVQLQRQDDVEIDITRQPYSLTDKKCECCCICMEQYKDEDTVSILKCEHSFHSECIEEWGHYKANCPICKEEIKSREDRKDLESIEIVE
jgi:hypothetical protein